MKPFFNPDTTLLEKLLSVGKLLLIIGAVGVMFFGPKPYDSIALALVVAYTLTKDIFDGIKFAKTHKWEESVVQFIFRLLNFIILALIIYLIFHK